MTWPMSASFACNPIKSFASTVPNSSQAGSCVFAVPMAVFLQTYFLLGQPGVAAARLLQRFFLAQRLQCQPDPHGFQQCGHALELGVAAAAQSTIQARRTELDLFRQAR